MGSSSSFSTGKKSLLQISVVIILFFVQNSNGQATVALKSSGNESEQLDLEKLSNEELEAICTDRGFELLKESDETSGEKVEISYTREDYLDAASQCLAIEAEMEKAIKENPEIIQELKDEASQMQQEKEKLEKELLEAQAILNEKQRIEETRNETEGTAFISETKQEDSKPDAKVQTNEVDEMIDEFIDLDQVSSNTAQTTKDNKQAQPKTEEENTSSQNTPELVGITQINPMNFTFLDLFHEVQAQIQRDLKVITNLLLPQHVREPLFATIKPFVKVGQDSIKNVVDMLFRYVSAIVMTAKKELVKSEENTENKPQ